jgi:CelD/BcsL family acetyltransferase involved in cellulose biosynthesis
MPSLQPAQTLFDRYAGDKLDRHATNETSVFERAPTVEISMTTDLASVEKDWRTFEAVAEGTVFQTFEWQSTYVENVAPHEAVTPAIFIGRAPDRAILFLIPLAVHGRRIRRLTWLAGDLSDYNAPLLAPDFPERVGPTQFAALWHDILDCLRNAPHLRPDVVILEKMPEKIGAQQNPFIQLGVSANPSNAYLTGLTENWDGFYSDKRSSATRRRDRTKRKRLGSIGELRFVTSSTPAAIEETLAILFAQKARTFAKMGVANIFERPGWADFFRNIAKNPANLDLVHVSRLEVGDQVAATNLGLVFGRKYYHILASYDDGEVSRYGPGAAHLHDLMRYAIDRKCEIFDFTIGDEGYKRDWSDSAIELYDFRSSLTWRGFLIVLPSSALTRIKRTIKQTPFLWRAVTKLRAVIGGRAREAGEASDD